MQVIDDVAERRFSWLLTQRGCTYVREGELEQVLAVRGPRPDFYVRSAAGPFLAEVKAFTQAGPIDRRSNRVFSIGVEEMMKPISSAVDEARRQLRAYRDLGIPEVVVLDNWRQVGVDLDDVMLMQLFGEIAFVVPVAKDGGPPGQTSLAYGGGRTLGDDAGTYVSAVIVTTSLERALRDNFVSEQPMRARVLHNPHATVPLPQSIFGTPDDEQLVHVDRVWHKVVGSAK
ncbi:MAG: hypothetical protein M3P18_07985 [Actinomycetota bacterium]|nr:hypothetical protein [Actinomycetota bacterium]